MRTEKITTIGNGYRVVKRVSSSTPAVRVLPEKIIDKNVYPIEFSNRKDKEYIKLKDRAFFENKINPSNIIHIMVTHFNIRFSVPHKGRLFERKWKRPLTKEPYYKEYMESRLKLFEDFCYPSVLNQINQNFHWFVYFDENTDMTPFAKFDKIIPIYLKSNDVFSHKRHLVEEVVKRRLLRKKKWILFTKLDNDDCLEKNWVNELQTIWTPITATLNRTLSYVVFTNGLLYIKRGNRKFLFDHKDRYNPFVNSIEKVIGMHDTNFETCWRSTHNQILGHIHPNHVLRMGGDSRPMYLINDQNFNLCDRDKKIEVGKNTRKDYEYIEDAFGINRDILL